MRRLRVVFMGTPAFAVPALAALHESPHEVVCVYTQPPRRSGRGMKETPSPVHAFALRHKIAVRTPASLKPAAEQKSFAGLEADAALIAAYGLILPPAILKVPRLGCLNIHPSLLPRWRGAAPIQRAILEGDKETGVTIMLVEKELDAGPILLCEKVPIGPDATAGALHDCLADMGARLAIQALDGLDGGRIVPRPQGESGVTYANKIAPGEERLDWRKDAAFLARKVRAFSPFPGTWFEHDGARIRVLAAAPEDGAVAGKGAAKKAPPGTVLDERLLIACADGALRPTRLQRAGSKAMDAADFLRGHAVAPGTRLPCPA
ncbi:MAG: methionyl-tRNA formyltransferase [Alphaproteobacteria bacterium]